MKQLLGVVLVCGFATGAFGQYSWTTPTSDTFGGGGGGIAANEYLLDDGTGETNLAWNAANGGDLVFLNQFNVIGGAETLTAISIAWGTGAGGSPASILVFDDPDNDGSPSDVTIADVLFSATIMTGAGPTDVFTNYAIAPTALGALGDSFFIGGFSSTPPAEFPARIDQTAPVGRSWVAGGNLGTVDPLDPNGFVTPVGLPLTNLSGFPFNGNFMVRGDAVPEPSTLVLLGLGAVAMLRRR